MVLGGPPPVVQKQPIVRQTECPLSFPATMRGNNNNKPHRMTALEFCDLVAGISPQYLCDYLDVNLRTLVRWKSGLVPVPIAIAILLQLKLSGDVSAIFGDAWHGFRFGMDGKLYIPFFHRGHTPLQICAMFFELQELHQLRVEVKRLALELDNERARSWARVKVDGVLDLRRVMRSGQRRRLD